MSRHIHEDSDHDFEFDSSWILPIIMLFAFPPVGVFLTAKKFMESRNHAKRTKNFKPLFSAGGVLTVLGAIFGSFLVSASGIAVLIGTLMGKRKGSRVENTYLTIIGDKPSISIRELSRITGRKQKQVIRDLEKMLDDGLLPDTAYIDHAAKVLVLRSEGRPPIDDDVIYAEVVDDLPRTGKAAPQPEPEQKAPEQDPAEREAAILKETFDAKLREIRYWNEQIDDEKVSARIDDIENITANIFYLVREKPERASEIRTFMNYYLPTTLKLLKAYARLEKQGGAGENVRTSRQEIERILDKLAEGFRQQLDRLFQADAIDISSDIDVLETMMAKDGLLEKITLSGGKR